MQALALICMNDVLHAFRSFFNLVCCNLLSCWLVWWWLACILRLIWFAFPCSFACMLDLSSEDSADQAFFLWLRTAHNGEGRCWQGASLELCRDTASLWKDLTCDWICRMNESQQMWWWRVWRMQWMNARSVALPEVCCEWNRSFLKFVIKQTRISKKTSENRKHRKIRTNQKNQKNKKSWKNRKQQKRKNQSKRQHKTQQWPVEKQQKNQTMKGKRKEMNQTNTKITQNQKRNKTETHQKKQQIRKHQETKPAKSGKPQKHSGQTRKNHKSEKTQIRNGRKIWKIENQIVTCWFFCTWNSTQIRGLLLDL